MFQELSSEFEPKKLLPSLMAGLVIGIIATNLTISFTALIYSGELIAYLPMGISLALFSLAVISIISALSSSLPGIISGPRSSPAAILGLGTAVIASSLAGKVSPDEIFLSVVAMVAFTSILAGVFFLLLGQFNLGNLVRFLPYPVIGGFLAGIGLLLVRGSLRVLTGASFHFADMAVFFQSEIFFKWFSGFLFALFVFFTTRKVKHFLVMPGILLGAIAFFYLILAVSGTSVAEAGAKGWLLGPFPESGGWKLLTFSAFSQANWGAIFAQKSVIFTVLILSAIATLLQVTGIELAVGQDMDLNKELKSAGWANLFSGLSGGMRGDPAPSMSILVDKMGAKSRLVGIFVAVFAGIILMVGMTMLSFLPKPIVGGLNMYIGFSFLTKWLYDGWKKFPKSDYAIVVLIFGVIGAVGFLQGVGVGLVAAMILFVVNYSRGKVVRHAMSAQSYRSNVERPRLYQQLIQQKGHWLYIAELQGFVFFGLANQLLEQVREKMDAGRLSPRYVLIDFRFVTGIDSSAALSFTKMKQLAKRKNIILIFTHLSEKIHKQLEIDLLSSGENTIWRIFSDLERGVAWCEDQMIETFESVGFAVKPKTLVEQLEESLPKSVPPEELLKYFEQEEVEKGFFLIQQGDSPKGLFFIESGEVTVLLELASGEKVRIRTAGEGTVIGELGMYLNTPATAFVVTEKPSVIYSLFAEKLCEMEEKDPEVATAFHRFIARLLAERLVDNTRALEVFRM